MMTELSYTTKIVENLLRSYYTLSAHPDSTFSFYKLDIESGLAKLKKQNSTLYSTIVNIFVNGMPIQEQAYIDDVSTRLVNYRLNDGLEALTNIMNGEVA